MGEYPPLTKEELLLMYRDDGSRVGEGVCQLLAEHDAQAKEIKRLQDGVQEIYDDDLSTKRVRHNRDTAIGYARTTAEKLLKSD